MDSENNWKPYEQMDDLGVKNPLWENTQMEWFWCVMYSVTKTGFLSCHFFSGVMKP